MALLLVLSGCGEKEEPATTGPVVQQTTTGTETTTTSTTGQTDQQLVAAAATGFLTSANAAAVCNTGVTEALIRTAYGDRAGCLAARMPQSLAQSAQLSDVQVGQGTATLAANARGGTYGSGQQVRMTLVRDGTGNWRVDSVQSNVPVGP